MSCFVLYTPFARIVRYIYCFLIVYIIFFFFFNDTATTEIYTLSLHDALPISAPTRPAKTTATWRACPPCWPADRKSTRLNSSHANISYAVFCLKKKYSSEFYSQEHLKWLA